MTCSQVAMRTELADDLVGNFFAFHHNPRYAESVAALDGNPKQQCSSCSATVLHAVAGLFSFWGINRLFSPKGHFDLSGNCIAVDHPVLAKNPLFPSTRNSCASKIRSPNFGFASDVNRPIQFHAELKTRLLFKLYSGRLADG